MSISYYYFNSVVKKVTLETLEPVDTILAT